MSRILTRREIARRILALPPAAREDAALAFARLYGGESPRGARAQAARTPAERRRYAGDPWAYMQDVLGIRLSPQQEEALELIERETRVLLPAANNVGKTFVLGAYGIYVLDAVSSLPDEDSGLEEQGGRVLLPGPDHATIKATIYGEMLMLARRAEERGYLMPGRRSENSVLWRVRPHWEVEALSPQRRVDHQVAHTASGRHHRNQIALIEEGQGVAEPLWLAAEGMCSSEGNKIVSSFNPTEPVGPAYQRARSGAYRILHLSALDHPNIQERRAVIPKAIAAATIDNRIRNQTRDRGPYPAVTPDEAMHDVVYALPPSLGTPERGPRPDGWPGHPDGELRVYRPEPAFVAQVLGRWPATSHHGLFDAAAVDAAMARGKASDDPAEPPDRIGVDAAREGDDDTCAAPSWGLDGDALLRRYLEARDRGEEAVAELLLTGRTRVGTIRVLPKGDGAVVGRALVRQFGNGPYNVDQGGTGSSPYDFLRHVHGADAIGVNFSGVAPPPIRDGFLPWCDNIRAWMYVVAAKATNLGLVDLPPDPLLREELLAHQTEPSSRVVEIDGRKRRVDTVRLPDKNQIKRKLGRSPDRADAFVLTLFSPPAVPSRKKKVRLTWGS